MEGINEAALREREREEAAYESRPVIGYCAYCNEPIRQGTERWEGDWYIDNDGELVHLDCWDAYGREKAREA